MLSKGKCTSKTHEKHTNKACKHVLFFLLGKYLIIYIFKMINNIHEILIGQILGDAHIEKGKSAKNCRISFSFGRNYYDYAN